MVIPVEQIETGIRAAAACVAEITTTNPNVWFELGYAIAAGKPVLLLATDEPGKRYPFDVQHRHVIRYRTDSIRDFHSLAEEITLRLRALLEKEEKLERAVSPPSLADIEGLAQHEIVALVAIAENLSSPSDRVSAYTIKNDMERAGFRRVATTLALAVLLRQHLVICHDDTDINGNPYSEYALSDKGMNWLLQNQQALALRREKPARQPKWDEDEEVPF